MKEPMQVQRLPPPSNFSLSPGSAVIWVRRINKTVSIYTVMGSSNINRIVFDDGELLLLFGFGDRHTVIGGYTLIGSSNINRNVFDEGEVSYGWVHVQHSAGGMFYSDMPAIDVCG